MSKIIHKELSYTVRGVLFDVYNELGPNLAEAIYQQAVAVGLEGEGIVCETEKQFDVTYRGVPVGRFYVDVWIEGGKLLLELKVEPSILPIHRAQAISYLKVTDADLAVVVNFGEGSLVDERLPNYLRGKQSDFVWQEADCELDVPDPVLTKRVVEALHRVHFELGSGYFHYVYRRATAVELTHQHIGHDYLKKVPIYYHGTWVGEQETRLLVVEQKILLVAVAIKEVDEGMKAQLRSRLKHLELSFGLLANFHGTRLDVSIVRAGRVQRI